ncbi:amidohydrolase [Sporobolomyces salmoneus]|uniref:amidohydrolase n=1 Tax=Sporobolomyces salmoneus TaxID=183962 RepID=UPI00316C6984
MVTVFVNARLVGFEDPRETYTVVVEGGKITTITPTSRAQEVPPAASNVYDLHGQLYLAPSLIDAHTHFTSWTLSTRRLDLYHCKSSNEVLELVKPYVEEQAKEEGLPFIVAHKMRVGEWEEGDSISRSSLDFTNKPLVILFAGLHSLCANSEALRRLGYEPEGRDGILLEGDCFKTFEKLNDISEDILDRWVDEAASKAAAMGVTQIVDLEWAFNARIWRRRYEKGTRSLRVSVGMYQEHLDEAIEAGHRTGDAVDGTEGLVTIGPHKIITDGSLGSRTAFCCDHYPSEPTNFGRMEVPVSTLKDLAEKATRNGLRLAVHAIGDAANRLTLETLAKISPPPLPGSSIEHAQLLTLSDIPLFTQLNLIASVQPCHLIDDRELAAKFWPGRTERAYAFASLVEAGVELKMGSDAPVAPIDPWDAIAVAVSRTARGEENSGLSWHPEQCISNEVAWKSSTWNGKVGIEVGEQADLVILASDPLKANANELRAMDVKATMLGGRVTHLKL